MYMHPAQSQFFSNPATRLQPGIASTQAKVSQQSSKTAWIGYGFFMTEPNTHTHCTKLQCKYFKKEQISTFCVLGLVLAVVLTSPPTHHENVISQTQTMNVYLSISFCVCRLHLKGNGAGELILQSWLRVRLHPASGLYVKAAVAGLIFPINFTVPVRITERQFQCGQFKGHLTFHTEQPHHT